MVTPVPTLGVLLRKLRSRHGWTLKQMSENSGIPLSTLSKIEHDRLTLTYDKLYQVSQRLGIPISELFAETGQDIAPTVTARRSLGDIDQALHVETPNYDYYFLCTELRRKRMIPVITKIRAKTSEEFGELVHHPGEEFIFVLLDVLHYMNLDEQNTLLEKVAHSLRGGGKMLLRVADAVLTGVAVLAEQLQIIEVSECRVKHRRLALIAIRDVGEHRARLQRLYECVAEDRRIALKTQAAVDAGDRNDAR